MKTDTLDKQKALARATGQREVGEQLVDAIRQHVVGWRGEEGKRGRIESALLWKYTAQWHGRLEQLVAALEQHVGTLRGQEANLSKEVAVLEVAAPLKPQQTRKPKPRKR
jgi:hypothetical protein